jgi:tripartite ATP-independent transporter DctM subunit
MTAESHRSPESASQPNASPNTNRRAGLKRLTRSAVLAENGLLAFCLIAIVILPLAEALLRKLFHTGISGAATFLQHFTLLIGMIGGAVAARESRLLSISTLGQVLRGRWQTLAQVTGNSAASLISIFLACASWYFLQAEREAGSTLAYGIRTWAVQLVMPLGFALIALRLVWHAGAGLWPRVAAAAAVASLTALLLKAPWTPAQWLTPALVLLLIATLLGAPIFAALGGGALIAFWVSDVPIASIPLTHYSLVTNPTLPTIPLFTLTGYLLAESQASRRLIRVFDAWLGQLRGGPAAVTALVCAFFTSFTGASGVTILALGGLLMPILVAAKYRQQDALGLLTSSASLGVLLPPCLPLILYAVVANANTRHAGVTIERMFLGGIGPSLLLIGLIVWWGVRQGQPSAAVRPPFSAAAAWTATWEAKWELLVPVVALVGLFGGFATPVEAAAITALYAFLIETVIHRDLSWRDFARVLKECGLLVGGVLLILGVALGLTNFLVDAQVPARAVEWATATIHSPLLFLLALNVVLILVGCLMDVYSAIVVIVPLIVPLGQAYQIDPVHLGIIFLANLSLGFLTPPVGMNLFLASYRFNTPILEVTRAILPCFLWLAVGVLVITYVPALTTFLPQWFGR